MKNLLKTLQLLAICLLLPAKALATTYYVKTTGSDAAAGTAWATAFQTLQKAISVANDGDEIWVAKGTYYPDEGPGQTNNERSAGFAVTKSVKLIGGFPNTGNPTMTQRNWKVNETMLSGEIQQDNNATNNAYNVMRLIISPIIVDGFTITGGHADGNDLDFEHGGGIFSDGSLTVLNCTLSNNWAQDSGGGIFNLSNITLKHCLFTGNTSDQSGGGLYNGDGSNTDLFSCAFVGNSSGIYNFMHKSFILNYCTFSGNQNGGVSNSFDSQSTLTFQIKHCIFWNNGGSQVSGPSGISIYKSILQGGCPNGAACDQVQDINPLFVNEPPVGVGTTGNIRLKTCSPAINAGSVEDANLKDLDGNPRVAFSTADLGAYEVQSLATTLYVKTTGNDNNDGTSWATAYKTLQKALQESCSGTQIWVAKGTYYPDEGPNLTDNDRTAAFSMKNDVAIYGGFPNIGSPSMADRNWATYKTILSGEIQQDNDPSNNSYHVFSNSYLNNTAILDGFTIMGGNANSSSANSQGGGMLNTSSSPSISNVIFSGNQAGSGGGMYNAVQSSPILSNVTFSGNNAASNGGGMHSYSYCSPILSNVIFSGNNATKGGGMYNHTSSPDLSNVTFSGNNATSEGGGMYNEFGYPSLKNCIFWGNSSEVFNDPGNPTYTKTLVKGRNLGSGIFDGTQDPLFVSQPPIGLGNGGNLRLQACSPALNVGNNADNNTTTDLDGNNRKVGIIDLGAYEALAQLCIKASVSTSVACVGSSISLSANGGTTYSWKGPNNFSSTSATPSLIVSALMQGVYSVTGFSGTVTGSATVTVNVIALKAGSIGTPCVGGSIQLTASGMTTYSWYRQANNFSSTLQNPVIPSAKLTDAGAYLVTGRNGSCTGSAMVLVIVTNPSINPAFTVSPSTIAQGAAITLSATSATGSYSWSGPAGFSGGTRSKTINSFQAANEGVYRLTLTSGLCKGYTEKTLVIGTATRLAGGEREEEIDIQINAYPNPVTNTLTVEVTLQKPSKLSLSLFNSIGNERGTWQLNEESAVHKTELDMSELTGGVYLLQAQAGKQKVVKRVVKIQY